MEEKVEYKAAYENVMIANKMLRKENQQLRQVLNEIREYLVSVIEIYDKYEDSISVAHFSSVLDKLTYLENKVKE